MDNKKASAVSLVLILVIALIAFGAISAFFKIQFQQADNEMTGFATSLPSTVEISDPADQPDEVNDTEPPKRPKFSITSSSG